MKQAAGFSMIEILLVVALMGVLAGLSMPFYQSYQRRNDVNIAADTIVQSARRAQQLARSVDGDSRWGIAMLPGEIVIFKGETYATRDTTEDERVVISPAIGFSGDSEVIFNRVTGNVDVPVTITVSAENGGSITITINAYGTVSY